MKRVAVFPGSFDPITVGHRSIVLRALPMFDIIYVAVGVNMEKKSTFDCASTFGASSVLAAFSLGSAFMPSKTLRRPCWTALC